MANTLLCRSYPQFSGGRTKEKGIYSEVQYRKWQDNGRIIVLYDNAVVWRPGHRSK
jgi:hypothetical protein